MRKMRNCVQLIFVARKMCKFAPTKKPVALKTLPSGILLILFPMHAQLKFNNAVVRFYTV